MAKYILTRKAIEDLTEIWEYGSMKLSEQQADRYYEQLVASFQLLVSRPQSGRPYEQVIRDLYGLRAEQHIVFYRALENGDVQIIRILHRRMDLGNRLREK